MWPCLSFPCACLPLSKHDFTYLCSLYRAELFYTPIRYRLWYNEALITFAFSVVYLSWNFICRSQSGYWAYSFQKGLEVRFPCNDLLLCFSCCFIHL
jgi:hypothetical protein